MFALGGAEVELAGFLRGTVPPEIPDAPDPLVLDHTADARLAQRMTAVARVLARGMDGLARRMDGVEAIVARNLEMLVIGRALQRRLGGAPRLVYEVLDLHRLLTAPGPAGQALRAVQGRLGRSVDLAITSSPAFMVQNLRHMPFADRVILVENKVLTEGPRPVAPPPAPPAPPFRIGWFGALRCARSLDLLAGLADRLAGRVEVVLRGRPSAAVFPDFAGRVARSPHLRFDGPYRASDLPDLYAGVHFSWCIDYYEEGHNSAWLLPNRLYESAAHLAVPMALAGVETGRFLRARNLGLVVDRTNLDSLVALFAGMTDGRHAALRQALADQHPDLWRIGPDECRALVAAIVGREEDGTRWPRLSPETSGGAE